MLHMASACLAGRYRELYSYNLMGSGVCGITEKVKEPLETFKKLSNKVSWHIGMVPGQCHVSYSNGTSQQLYHSVLSENVHYSFI